MIETLNQYVVLLNESPWKAVVAITGGGSLAISDLLAEPGGSATILEAVVPYDRSAMRDFLRKTINSACSAETARLMAQCAFERARRYSNQSTHIAGIGCTASLVSLLPKHGAHRVHVATCIENHVEVRSLVLNKGERSRAEEERIAADLVHRSLAALIDIDFEFALLPGETIES